MTLGLVAVLELAQEQAQRLAVEQAAAPAAEQVAAPALALG